jgi:N-acylneuraminate cytidylyltransferase
MSGTFKAFIFARGGSVGLPGKNLKSLGGKPLIAHAIDIAMKCPRISEVLVSTDDPVIANVAKSCGAAVPWLRPAELASNTAREWDAWRHAIRMTYGANASTTDEAFVSLPATAPLRSVADVEASLDRFLVGDVDMVLTVRKSDQNPYFNMVRLQENGQVTLAAQDAGSVYRRQDAPEVFDLVPVAYVTRPSFVLRRQGLFDGRVGMVEVPKERAVDIDDDLDFAMAEMLYCREHPEWQTGGEN